MTLASRTAAKVEVAAAEIGAHAVAAERGNEDDCIASLPSTGSASAAWTCSSTPRARDRRPVDSLQAEHVDLQLDVNIRGLLLVLAERRSRCSRRSRGGIVNLASMAGTADARTDGVRRDQAAVIALTHSQNAELDGDGGRAMAPCPGFVDTPMAEWSGITPTRRSGRRIAPKSFGCAFACRPQARVPQVVIERVGSTERGIAKRPRVSGCSCERSGARPASPGAQIRWQQDLAPFEL